MSELRSPGVRHDRKRRRFEIAADGGPSVLDYVLEERTAVLTHTEVPPALRGRGLAEKLVRAALAWAEEEKLRVEPACSYAARFIQRHPEYARLLAHPPSAG
jgi:predicted GNAT family acetyltransferase